MYVEEIIAKRKGKEYKTLLVRESFREGSTVSHRTIANISHLPQGCIEEIKRYLKGNSINPNFSQIQVIDSKEYGASQSVLSIARKLKLDSMILSTKVQWREDILAMIVGRLLYPGNELSLTNMFSDTVLWESCGHLPNTPPNVDKNCYHPLSKLLSRQDTVQKKMQDLHLEKNSVVLLFFTTSVVEEEKEHYDFSFFNNEDCKQGCNELITTLLTNLEGCPLGVEACLTVNEDKREIYQRIKKNITESLQQPVILVGYQKMFPPSIDNEFNSIIGLTLGQIKIFIEKNSFSQDLFSCDQFHEIHDPHLPLMRYILYLNKEKRSELSIARNDFISKAEKLLIKVQKKKDNIIAEVDKIWKLFDVKEFFNWHIVEEKLHFSINGPKLLKEQQLDGCYIIRTNVEKSLLTGLDIFNIYQKLDQVQQCFKSIKTITTKMCQISLEERIHATVFLSMLSYYLQWHMNKKLETAFEMNGGVKVNRWTFNEIIEKLKSIRSQTIQVGGITLGVTKTILNEEQREIASMLGVVLESDPK